MKGFNRMSSIKYLLTDPSYILDPFAWKALVVKASRLESDTLSFSDALRTLLALEFYSRGTKEELEGVSLNDLENGIKKTWGDGDFEIYGMDGRYLGVATTDSGMLALIPYSIYEKNKIEIDLNSLLASVVKLEDFDKNYRFFITD